MAKKKGFVLIEALAAALALAIVALGISGVIAVEKSVLNQMFHRMEAINYARSAADILLNEAMTNPRQFQTTILDVGTHTDADVVEIPAGFFKDTLNGKMSYKVEEITIKETPMLKVEITVNWKEVFPKQRDCKENLVFAVLKPMGW